MKLLFYVQPQIEEGMPLFRLPMVEQFVLPFVAALQNSLYRGKFEFHLATNSFLLDTVTMPEIQKHRIEAGQDFSATIGDIQPDIILCPGSFPELRAAFPTTLILHVEYSVFSRLPYPATVYFDPIDMMGHHNFLNAYAEHIERTEPDERESMLLHSMKRMIKCHIASTNPYHDFMQHYRSKAHSVNEFRAIVLLPLGGGDSASLLARINTVMTTVPADVGVIVTTHPDRNYLRHGAMAAMMKRFPNLIWSPEFENIANQSAYLIQCADGLIIYESTSVIFQALIWDIPVLYMDNFKGVVRGFDFGGDWGHNYFDLCNCRVHEKFNSNILFWLLTRYAVHSDYFLDGVWFGEFLERCFERWQRFMFVDADDFCNFFAMIDTPEKVMNKIAADVKRFPPVQTTASHWSHDKLVQTVLEFEKIIAGQKELLEKLGIDWEQFDENQGGRTYEK